MPDARIRAQLEKDGAAPLIDCRPICGSRFCCVASTQTVRVPACLFDSANAPAIRKLEATVGARKIVERCNAIAPAKGVRTIGTGIRVDSATRESPLSTVTKAGLDPNRCSFCCWSAPGPKSVSGCGLCCDF
jgi:hypothetical protein